MAPQPLNVSLYGQAFAFPIERLPHNMQHWDMGKGGVWGNFYVWHMSQRSASCLSACGRLVSASWRLEIYFFIAPRAHQNRNTMCPQDALTHTKSTAKCATKLTQGVISNVSCGTLFGQHIINIFVAHRAYYKHIQRRPLCTHVLWFWALFNSILELTNS